MTLAELEKHLDRGEEWGFVKGDPAPGYLGWILIHKRKPRPVPPFDPRERPDAYQRFLAQGERLRRLPYFVLILELRKEAHESDNYETNEDYRLREHYEFPALTDVQAFLETLGYRLSEIRHRSEIDAP